MAIVYSGVVISIHALLAESDPTFIVYSITDKYISIHALLAESDKAVIMSALTIL